MIRDYRCTNCEKEFEMDVPTTSNLESRKVILVKCSTCGSTKVVRVIRVAPVAIFKGRGFYKTDSKKVSS